MALIDEDQVKAEIERRLSNIVTGLDFTAEIELKGLLSFLDSTPPIQSLNRDHVARIIELWQDVEHDVEWCNEPSEFMYDEVLRRFNLDTLSEQPKLKPMNIPSGGGGMSTTPPSFKLDVKPEQPVEEPEYYQHFDPDC